ncbi:GNAT family N-acetyltransferase [Pseudoroseicyclus sp. H15]
MRIFTDRLVLRDLIGADLPKALSLVSKFDIVRWRKSWPWPADMGSVEDAAEPELPADRYIEAAVEFGGEFVGIVSLIDGDLAYMFITESAGKGVATEAARGLLNHTFQSYPDLTAITAGVYDGNQSAIRVLLKLGFTQIGSNDVWSRAKGEVQQGSDWQLTREAWMAASAQD